VSRLDLVDETFVVAPVSALLVLCDESTWQQWFPGLSLTCVRDRGRLGKRWSVRGDQTGTAEVWLEEYGDGVIVHTYLRVELGEMPARAQRRAAVRLRRRYGLPIKSHLFAVKDELEGGRRPGEPRHL